MNKLIITITIVAMTAAAQLPSNTYLPSSGSGQHSTAQLPSNTYLPSSGSGQHSAAQLPSNTYIPSSGSGHNSGAPGSPGSLNGHGNGNGNGHGNGHDNGYGNGNGDSNSNGNTRPQQEIERNAAILKMINEADENGFQYGYETSNGIQAEESGNAAQTQGGFSYKGDDGQVYSVRFTAGEDGFRPEGAHLPVPPPTPAEILLALQQNEKDEAAGIFDDGLYHPENKDQNGQGSGYQESFNPNTGYRY